METGDKLVFYHEDRGSDHESVGGTHCPCINGGEHPLNNHPLTPTTTHVATMMSPTLAFS